MQLNQPIAPCLWFDNQAQEAAAFYIGIFENSQIANTSYYGEEGHELHGQPAGSVLTVAFELNGQPFTAINGGSAFKINEAISLQVMCDTQDVLNYYWDALSAGGDEVAQQCGWLKDKFGVSWQIVPSMMGDLMSHPDAAKAGRAMTALLQMKKLDIAALRNA